MISHTHKCIFIHIRKTAGISIRNVIGECDGTHDGLHFHNHLYHHKNILSKQLYSEYFKFTFVRNPWDFMISKYKDIWFTSKHPGGPIGERVGKSLKYFLEHYKNPSHEKGETFHDYFDPEQMDFIGRFENRENDLQHISQKIGVNIDSNIHLRKVQMRNKNKKHYTEYYDDETRQIVAERYAKDIEYFGYKFGEQ